MCLPMKNQITKNEQNKNIPMAVIIRFLTSVITHVYMKYPFPLKAKLQ